MAEEPRKPRQRPLRAQRIDDEPEPVAEPEPTPTPNRFAAAQVDDSPPQQPGPQWAPDPWQQGMMRWWDGRQWTRSTSVATGRPQKIRQTMALAPGQTPTTSPAKDPSWWSRGEPKQRVRRQTVVIFASIVVLMVVGITASMLGDAGRQRDLAAACMNVPNALEEAISRGTSGPFVGDGVVASNREGWYYAGGTIAGTTVVFEVGARDLSDPHTVWPADRPAERLSHWGDAAKRFVAARDPAADTARACVGRDD